MAKIEDQRILVWCNCSEKLKSSIIDAVYLAIKLEKEVCLFANYKNEKDKEQLQRLVNSYAHTIKKDMPQLDVSTLVLKGKLADLTHELGEKYNAILLCCNGKINKELMDAFYRSSFPFFFTKTENTSISKFKKVIIPIDFRNSTKDATLWGSYLGRFNQSDVVLLSANDKTDGEQQEKVDKIVAFVKRFYGQFFFNYWIEKGNSGSWKIHNEAAEAAKDFDLMVFTGSLNVSALDRITGTFEQRIINNIDTSVLLINPQKEMYLLCN